MVCMCDNILEYIKTVYAFCSLPRLECSIPRSTPYSHVCVGGGGGKHSSN